MLMLEFIQDISESIAAQTNTHIEHPEDLVFTDGSQGAIRALQSINGVIAQPNTITIKWDGYPALIFGRNHDGQMIVADKHMFTKKDGTGRHSTSVQAFMQYDANRGVNRGDLYEQLTQLWTQFEQALPQGAQGYYWGDLLWTGRPVIQGNEYVFQPNTVQYHIPVNSELGKRISKSGGGIAIHQYFSDFDTPPRSLNGTGELDLNGALCILSTQMTDTVVLKTPVQFEKIAQAVIRQNGAAVDKLVDPINLSSIKCTNLPALMKTYINSRIRGETRSFYEWIPEKLSTPKLQRLIGENNDGYLYQNADGVAGAMAIHTALSNLKNNIVQQLDSQQQAIKATVNGKTGGEGYVANTQTGLIKLVNRAAFSAANFARNM